MSTAPKPSDPEPKQPQDAAADARRGASSPPPKQPAPEVGPLSHELTQTVQQTA